MAFDSLCFSTFFCYRKSHGRNNFIDKIKTFFVRAYTLLHSRTHVHIVAEALIKLCSIVRKFVRNRLATIGIEWEINCTVVRYLRLITMHDNWQRINFPSEQKALGIKSCVSRWTITSNHNWRECGERKKTDLPGEVCLWGLEYNARGWSVDVHPMQRRNRRLNKRKRFFRILKKTSIFKA